MSENEGKGSAQTFPKKMTQQAFTKIQGETSVAIYRSRAAIARENAAIAQLELSLNEAMLQLQQDSPQPAG